MDRVQIFDTTLRDGEQSPGATMNVGEKLVIARPLGFPGARVVAGGRAAALGSLLAARPAPPPEGAFGAGRKVAEPVTRPIVLSLARTREQDVDRAIKSVER